MHQRMRSHPFCQTQSVSVAVHGDDARGPEHARHGDRRTADGPAAEYDDGAGIELPI